MRFGLLDARQAAALERLRPETGGVYSTADLAVLLGKPRGAFLSKAISRGIRDGWFARVRNALYADLLHGYSPEILGQRWVEPSYLTAEKALDLHGLVDTGVLVYTFATTRALLRRSDSDRRFEGNRFLYRHISPPLFFGFEHRDGVMIARPEKAALDFLYFRSKGSATLLAVEDVDWEGVRGRRIFRDLRSYPRAFQTWASNFLASRGLR